jgi:hypothetical protein
MSRCWQIDGYDQKLGCGVAVGFILQHHFFLALHHEAKDAWQRTGMLALGADILKQ